VNSALSLFFFCSEAFEEVRVSYRMRGGQSSVDLVWFGAPSNQLGRDPTVIVAGMEIRRLVKLFEKRCGEVQKADRGIGRPS
jgi:hypothetical protein